MVGATLAVALVRFFRVLSAPGAKGSAMIVGERIGQQLGEYRLVRLLGRSRFTEIYYGEHLELSVPVAVKVLNWRYLREGMSKFLDHACTMAQLEHPHIVRVLDMGIESGTPYMVMNYAPYGTLREFYPRHERIPLETVVKYVKQLADALQYVHDQCLIHRDIKPHNMLLGPEKQVWLSDFGIAMHINSLDHDQENSNNNEASPDFEGTVVYAAPEQLQGRPRRSSDQYSLAVVAYEWLSGEWPFKGDFNEIARQHIFDLPPSLRKKGVKIPSQVEKVMLKALEKDPARRYRSIREFAEALEWASIGERTMVIAAQPKKQFRPPQPFVVRVG